MEKFYDSALKSLKSIKCDICEGLGHYGGQCGTFKAMDRMMKASPYNKKWIEEKKGKINNSFYEEKNRKRKIVAEKLEKDVAKIEANEEMLKIYLGKKRQNMQIPNDNNWASTNAELD